MAIDKNSNGFTFMFASVMVVLTAILLAVAAISLKPFQDDNIRKEKMQNILASLRLFNVSANEAEARFNSIVKQQIVLNSKGEIEEGLEAFKIDIQKEYKEWKAGARKEDDLHFPLYICDLDGKTYYALPVVGTGLWGPIWGYITLESDMNTVYGANFDHKGETPGLGAEIKTEIFQKPFIGKTIFDENGNYTSINVVKGGASPEDMHGVDAISGGTITSNGVTEMLHRSINMYVPYLSAMRKNNSAEARPEALETPSENVINDPISSTDQNMHNE